MEQGIRKQYSHASHTAFFLSRMRQYTQIDPFKEASSMCGWYPKKPRQRSGNVYYRRLISCEYVCGGALPHAPPPTGLYSDMWICTHKKETVMET